MSNGPGDGRTIPVEPPVHVERFPTHRTATWKGGSPARFIDAVGGLDGVSPVDPVVVDDASTAGRERRSVAAIEAGETVRYLRVEPDLPWTASWEQRTWPVVSVSGAAPPALCRELHLRTTDCAGWPSDAFDRLVGLVD